MCDILSPASCHLVGGSAVLVDAHKRARSLVLIDLHGRLQVARATCRAAIPRWVHRRRLAKLGGSAALVREARAAARLHGGNMARREAGPWQRGALDKRALRGTRKLCWERCALYRVLLRPALGLVGHGVVDRIEPRGEVGRDGGQDVGVFARKIVVLADVRLEVIQLRLLAVCLVARDATHRELPLAVPESVAVGCGRHRLVEHPAHATRRPLLAAQNRHHRLAVESPVRLLGGPLDVEHVHHRGEEVGGHDSAPRGAGGTLDHGGPRDEAGHAMTSFPHVALAATQHPGRAGSLLRPVDGALAVTVGKAVFLGSVVAAAPPDERVVVVAQPFERVEHTANRSIKLVEARIKVELILGIRLCSFVWRPARLVATALGPLGWATDVRDVAVVERYLRKEWPPSPRLEEADEAVREVSRVVHADGVGQVGHAVR
mmetsp:Transcript_32833/g.89920  ORF Transcript_32833/g.89920 Transcript_32833/m.89920 type:complete len:433 (+) Transcript_32833:335-1633(+)